jgi:PHS family inorganic phosphate transporter-like MFS transporter
MLFRYPLTPCRYDIFAISLASVMIGLIYGAEEKKYLGMPYKALNGPEELSLKIAAPVGVFFGQLFFGWFADLVGRKKMCEKTISNAY